MSKLINISGIKEHLPACFTFKENEVPQVPVFSRAAISIFQKVVETLPGSTKRLGEVRPLEHIFADIEKEMNARENSKKYETALFKVVSLAALAIGVAAVVAGVIGIVVLNPFSWAAAGATFVLIGGVGITLPSTLLVGFVF